MSKKKAENYERDYTNPTLREQLKEEIRKGNKGGRPGQWSARKSQLLKKQYEDNGGAYKHPGLLSESQKNLKGWTTEQWETIDHQKATKGNKTARYLPKEIWNSLTEEEKKEANQSKLVKGNSKNQYIRNTPVVKEKLRKLHKESK